MRTKTVPSGTEPFGSAVTARPVLATVAGYVSVVPRFGADAVATPILAVMVRSDPSGKRTLTGTLTGLASADGAVTSSAPVRSLTPTTHPPSPASSSSAYSVPSGTPLEVCAVIIVCCPGPTRTPAS